MARLRKLADWLAGAGMSRCREQFAGRIGGMSHPQPLGHFIVAASLPGHDQMSEKSEFATFEKTMTKLMAVPHSEIKARLEADSKKSEAAKVKG